MPAYRCGRILGWASSKIVSGMPHFVYLVSGGHLEFIHSYLYFLEFVYYFLSKICLSAIMLLRSLKFFWVQRVSQFVVMVNDYHPHYPIQS